MFNIIKKFIRENRNFILVCIAVVLIGLFLYGNLQPKALAETMAWIYPGEPACSASAEYSDGRVIDVLKPEYFNVNNSGVLDLATEQSAGCNGFSPDNLAGIKKYSKEQYITVANTGASGLSVFLARSTTNEADINTLVSFVVNNDVTGIEIDFENFSSWDGNMYLEYKQFLQKLGDALHAKNKKLMIDGPAIVSAEQNLFIFKYGDMAKLPIDKVVILIYDYEFDHGVGQPVSPIGWIQDVISATKKNFPDTSKITAGIPSYGYVGSKSTGQIKLLTFDQTRNELGFIDSVRDPASLEMTWTNGDNVYFYQDSQSMALKVKVIQNMGISSISIWHLGGNPWYNFK